MADRSGSSEQHQQQILIRREQCRIAHDKLLSESRDLYVRMLQLDPCIATAAAKARQVIVPTKKPVPEGAAQIGNGGTEDEAGIVDRHAQLAGGQPDAVQKR